MDLMLLWQIMACSSIPSILATKVTFSQSPSAIVLTQLNSTAELQCSTSYKEPIGLYLRQGYISKQEVFYLHIKPSTLTINSDYKHRLSVKGECCKFTLALSQLQTRDTDGYYCEWVLAEPRITMVQSRETVIIVRDGDPEEECNKKHMVHHMLLMISIAITVTTFVICLGLLIWRIHQVKQSKKHYIPYKAHYRHHLQHCPNSRR